MPKLPRRKFLHLVAGTAALPALSRVASAQAYPTRPIRLVIPFPPGGVFDAVGRPWADKMRPLLGTVVAENVGGAGSSLGAAAVARAQPDGYTLLLGGSGALVFNPLAATRQPYDPIKDFEPITLLGRNPWSIVVHPSVPATTLVELIDYAKSNRGKLSYGSAGVGSGNHLTGELFKALIEVPDIVHVPFRGAGPAITALIGGQVPMATPSLTAQVIELHRSGQLRLIAVTGRTRVIAAPEFPTAIEAGLSGLIGENFIGLFAPSGTPNAIIEQIARATHKALSAPDLAQLYIGAGFEPYLNSSPQDARKLVEDEIDRWRPIIKSIGLKLD